MVRATAQNIKMFGVTKGIATNGALLAILLGAIGRYERGY